MDEACVTLIYISCRYKSISAYKDGCVKPARFPSFFSFPLLTWELDNLPVLLHQSHLLLCYSLVVIDPSAESQCCQHCCFCYSAATKALGGLLSKPCLESGMEREGDGGREGQRGRWRERRLADGKLQHEQ